jgi:signal peptidase I
MKPPDYMYAGPSMNPTLRSGDVLRVIPCGEGEIRVGDVIFFYPPDRRRCVIHRVVSVDSPGIRTRGDNNLFTDDWILTPADIAGRVISAQRGNRCISIHGGVAGRTIAYLLRLILTVRKILSFVLRPVYLYLARSGIFRRYLPVRLKTRVVRYKRRSGTELQLLLGNRIIGNRSPGWSHWRIRVPFRLFIDDSSLP